MQGELMTGWLGWLEWTAIVGAAWLVLAVAGGWVLAKLARMHPDPTPDAPTRPSLCDDPPCDPEEWWICDAHLPKGKHHPPPLRYGPEPIVGRCEWSDEMETRLHDA